MFKKDKEQPQALGNSGVAEATLKKNGVKNLKGAQANLLRPYEIEVWLKRL